MGQNGEFWPRESISLRNLRPVVRKVSRQDCLPALAAQRPKIPIWLFWPWCNQMVLLTGVRLKPGFGTFEVRPWVKFSKFWLGETSNLYANGPKRFPPEFYTHFGRPTTENYESVFLTVVWPNGVLTSVWPKPGSSPFHRRATISLPPYFWPVVRLMGG